MRLRTAVRSLGLTALLLSLVTLQTARAATPDKTPPLTITTVSGASPFTNGCNGAPASGVQYANAEVEPWVSANPKDPMNFVGFWQQDRWSDGGSNGLVAGVTHDGGKTWKETIPHFSTCAGGTAANGGNYPRSSDPWVSFGPDGSLYAISLSFSNNDNTSAVLVSKSTNGGDTWAEPVALIAENNPADGGFNDKESITADPLVVGNVYAVWDRGTNDAQPELFSRSTDGGATWEAARVIFTPAPGGFVIGSQIVVLPDGTLVDVFAAVGAADREGPKPDAAPVNPPTISIIRSTDKGQTWSAPIKVGDFEAVGVADPATGNGLRTADILPEIAVDAKSGALYATWQDGRFNRFKNDSVAFATSTDGGKTWSKPKRINKTATTPAFDPAIHVAADGTIGVSYYDFRNFKKKDSTLKTNYWLALSRNGGKTWREVALTGPFDMRNAPDARGLFVGDYQGLTTSGNNFLSFFVATNTGNTANRTDAFASPIIPSTTHGTTYAAAADPMIGTTPHIDWLARLRSHQTKGR